MVWIWVLLGIGTAIGGYFFAEKIKQWSREQFGFELNEKIIAGGGALLGSIFLRRADLEDIAAIAGLAGTGLIIWGALESYKKAKEEYEETRWREVFRNLPDEAINPNLPEDVKRCVREGGYIKIRLQSRRIEKETFTICEDPMTGRPKTVTKHVLKLKIVGEEIGCYPEDVWHLHIHSKMIDNLVYVYHPKDGVLFNAYTGNYICYLPYQKGRLYFHRIGDYGVIEIYGIPVNKAVEIHFSIKGCVNIFGSWKCPFSEDKIHWRTWSNNVYINCCVVTDMLGNLTEECKRLMVSIYDRIRYPLRGMCSKYCQCVKDPYTGKCCFSDSKKRCIEENPDFDLIKCETEEVEVL